MSISNPLVVIVGAVTYSCNRIGDAGVYGSEYFGKDVLSELTVKIRHTKMKPGSDGILYDRHNVEMTETIYAVGDVPQYQRRAYFVSENKRADTAAYAVDTGEGLVDFLTDAHLLDLVNWVN